MNSKKAESSTSENSQISEIQKAFNLKSKPKTQLPAKMNDRFQTFNIAFGKTADTIVIKCGTKNETGKLLFSTSVMAILVCSVIGLIAVLLGKAWKIPLVYSASRIF